MEGKGIVSCHIQLKRFAEVRGLLILLAIILMNDNSPLLRIFYSPKSNTQDESPQA
jgi:hypothetical protein